jgi:hypothetical protein
MDRLAYLAAMALLGIGLTMAQNTNSNPSSDPSNSSNHSVQAQSSTSAGAGEQLPSKGSRHYRTAADSQADVPNTVQDQQNSTTSTTGVSGQTHHQPSSAMSTPDSAAQGNQRSTVPQNDAPVDQQPNSSNSPGSNPPHAALTQGPVARAAATHTPDPGTCMNPAALQPAQANGQTTTSSPCR